MSRRLLGMDHRSGGKKTFYLRLYESTERGLGNLRKSKAQANMVSGWALGRAWEAEFGRSLIALHGSTERMEIRPWYYSGTVIDLWHGE